MGLGEGGVSAGQDRPFLLLDHLFDRFLRPSTSFNTSLEPLLQ